MRRKKINVASDETIYRLKRSGGGPVENANLAVNDCAVGGENVSWFHHTRRCRDDENMYAAKLCSDDNGSCYCCCCCLVSA